MKEIKFRKLKAEEIEVKVGSKSKPESKKQYIDLLLYKTARTDMDILDETVGHNNWQNYYETVKDNLYCIIEIWDEDKKQWIKKSDCGVESAFGDKQKGEASDAFKRAGFRCGIGRELYSSPHIRLWEGSFKPFEKYFVDKITYKNGKIDGLKIVNQNGDVVFTQKPTVKDSE